MKYKSILHLNLLVAGPGIQLPSQSFCDIFEQSQNAMVAKLVATKQLVGEYSGNYCVLLQNCRFNLIPQERTKSGQKVAKSSDETWDIGNNRKEVTWSQGSGIKGFSLFSEKLVLIFCGTGYWPSGVTMGNPKMGSLHNAGLFRLFWRDHTVALPMHTTAHYTLLQYFYCTITTALSLPTAALSLYVTNHCTVTAYYNFQQRWTTSDVLNTLL